MEYIINPEEKQNGDGCLAKCPRNIVPCKPYIIALYGIVVIE